MSEILYCTWLFSRSPCSKNVAQPLENGSAPPQPSVTLDKTVTMHLIADDMAFLCCCIFLKEVSPAVDDGMIHAFFSATEENVVYFLVFLIFGILRGLRQNECLPSFKRSISTLIRFHHVDSIDSICYSFAACASLSIAMSVRCHISIRH